MAAEALLKFIQGSRVGEDGHALIVDGGVSVDISNAGDSSDINSWRLELLSAPPGSIYENVPGVPTLLAESSNGSTAISSIVPPAADKAGCLRVRLSVWTSVGFVGTPDVDIRNICVLTPVSAIVLPPYQKLPDPLPLEGLGSKPDELNFEGQPWGYAGPNYDHAVYGQAFVQFRLLNALFQHLDSGGGGGGTPGGTNRQLQFNDAGVFNGTPGFEYNTSGSARLIDLTPAVASEIGIFLNLSDGSYFASIESYDGGLLSIDSGQDMMLSALGALDVYADLAMVDANDVTINAYDNLYLSGNNSGAAFISDFYSLNCTGATGSTDVVFSNWENYYFWGTLGSSGTFGANQNIALHNFTGDGSTGSAFVAVDHDHFQVSGNGVVGGEFSANFYSTYNFIGNADASFFMQLSLGAIVGNDTGTFSLSGFDNTSIDSNAGGTTSITGGAGGMFVYADGGNLNLGGNAYVYLTATGGPLEILSSVAPLLITSSAAPITMTATMAPIYLDSGANLQLQIAGVPQVIVDSATVDIQPQGNTAAIFTPGTVATLTAGGFLVDDGSASGQLEYSVGFAYADNGVIRNVVLTPVSGQTAGLLFKDSSAVDVGRLYYSDAGTSLVLQSVEGYAVLSSTVSAALLSGVTGALAQNTSLSVIRGLAPAVGATGTTVAAAGTTTADSSSVAASTTIELLVCVTLRVGSTFDKWVGVCTATRISSGTLTILSTDVVREFDNPLHSAVLSVVSSTLRTTYTNGTASSVDSVKIYLTEATELTP